MAKRVAQAGGTSAQLASYVGIAKQLVVDTNTFRVHVMDVSTAGGIPLARMTDLQSIDLSRYLTKTDASSTYLGKNDKAVSAGSADKAISDASGNNISTTYATKEELSTGLDSKQAAGSYLTTESATNTYLTISNASGTYLTKTDASNSYLGKTANAVSATKATQDGNGNVITATYLTKNDASSTYLGKTAKATSASLADQATKASQDANGNTITEQYATKDELNNSSQGIDSAILAEQMIGFYNAVEGTNLNQQDYLELGSTEWTNSMNEFVNGYEGKYVVYTTRF